MARYIIFLEMLVIIKVSAVLCDYPFQNISLSWEERVDNLVSLLTFDEMVAQMSHGGAGLGPAPSIPRLGINEYQWNTECLRGDAQAPGDATAFPQALGLSAMFSTDMLYLVANATGTEVRAKNNDFVKRSMYTDHTGLSCFSPVINIMRHPLWGRNQETYGEDPYLTGELSVAFVRGLQGEHPRFVRATSGCKHFDAHSGPENIPVNRFSFDAKVSDRDWFSTYLPAFKTCVQKGGTYNIMCSYNRLNGIPACANKRLLTDILRKAWGFKGYVVSDEGALENIIDWHKYLNNTVDTAAACVNAGTNLALSQRPLAKSVYNSIGEAVKQGKITKSTIVELVKPLFYTRMRLGEFDPPESNPYKLLPLSVVQSDEHQQLAIKAAMMSFVLLKNTNNFLPLKQKVGKIAIIGPMAHNPVQLFGDYSPSLNKHVTKTPLEGLIGLGDSLGYAPGCNDTKCMNYSSHEIKLAVYGADLIIICLGTGPLVEMESNDRASMDLPGKQMQLYIDAAKYGGKAPIIVLLFNAGPLNVVSIDADHRTMAIMECFFPAQATGQALYNVLTNRGPDSVPAARLPFTWPMSENQVPLMVNYSMAGRTYRYFQGPGEPLYAFGYGLSYTYFNYDKLTVIPPVVTACKNVTAIVTLSNVGPVAGDEVVQLYISWNNVSVPTPKWQLVGFQRVYLHTSSSIDVKFNITANQMAVWTDGGGWEVMPGVITVYAGGQQPNQTRSSGAHVISTKFTIQGSCHLPI